MQLDELKAAKEVFSDLAESILIGGAYKMTRFLGPKLTVKATRKRYKGKFLRGHAIEIMFTVGPPNYEEREAIKRAKKAGETLDTVAKFPSKK